MSVQAQQTVPPAQQAPQEDTPQTDLSGSGGGAGNQARVQALTGSAVGEPRGGSHYLVQRGDTLVRIAEVTYGNGCYWKDIMRANPQSVFRGGELILVGDTLSLPVIRIPTGGGATACSPVTGGQGGQTAAAVSREVCTEWGDFSIYPDDYVGELPQGPDGSQSIREAEYAESVEQREREAEEQTSTAVSEVEELLSYGALDYAITDADARAALGKLGGLSMRGLQAAVGRIDVERLLANLPTDAVASPDFAKVAVALGPDRIAPYLADVLSYTSFEWVVTEADARAVLSVLGALGAEQRAQVLATLGRDMQVRFIESLSRRGSALASADKAVLRSIFDEAGNDVELLLLAFEIRFNLDARGKGGAAWDETGLRRSWSVLEELPAAHAEGNPELLQWIRYGNSSSGHSGWYADEQLSDGAANPDFRGAGMKYEPNKMEATQNSEFDLDGDGTLVANERDPLHGVNRFNKIVRHEVGHAVEEQLGGVGRYCAGKASGGDWSDYGSNQAGWVDAMVAASAAGVANSGAKEVIVAQLNTDATPSNAANALANVQALPEYQALSDAEKAIVDADPVFDALAQAVDDPWYNHLPAGGVPLGGQIFQRSYASQWTAYAQEARARKVSLYQFRAPSEWFAEAYAAYYEPKADGSCDHSTLDGIDPDTKTWFDVNVDHAAGSR
ncbi:MAG: LysM peptidoglycan-binding domain-containing protein [Pseudomonadota bacterium]|nr:LysM peptidoglycan-binding domain-containing protein [Pseudomonadota bacterium]